MVKVRMNTADVAAEVACLRRFIGMRCANVYDISPKTYLFKLMNSSGITESGESEKVLLLMESGVRLHTTAYTRDKSTTPSVFTLKLRKHIRTKRLEDVRQLGYDRIILFQFGLGVHAHYVILELYSQGNILLTDSEFIVMTLLRSHRDDDKGLAIMSRHHYPVEACRLFKKTTFTKLQEALTSSTATVGETVENAGLKSSDQSTNKGKRSISSDNKVNETGRSSKSTLKVILGEVLGYGPAIAEHIILDASLHPNMKIGKDGNCEIDDYTIKLLSEAVMKFEDWLGDVISGQVIPEGYILMKAQPKDNVLSEDPGAVKVYDEFSPILLNQFKSREFMNFDTFDAAIDEFYSKIESQKSEQQQKAKEAAALQKLSKIRMDQNNRVHALKKDVDHSIRMGELIEYNLEDVEAAILAVRVALASGMDWKDLALMVKEEKKSGNPVAGLIDKLHLERNCITLLLSNNLDDMDEDEITRPVDKVEVDLALSAHANARHWFELKKKQESKQEKTVTAHERAFKAAERKTRMQLAQEKTVAAISHMRKVHWFEKFNWFISSENYLVISGRDAQQNEMIVKRYMSKGDLYIHADLHGASSTVIKNHKPENPVPPLTLNQAGCYTVCQSQAWDSKIVTSAWWVYPHQVSKTAPTGEYLTVGSFMIRGKKNFLPPHPLVMGFGILFRLDESSLASHLNERRVKGEDEILPDEDHILPKGQVDTELEEDACNQGDEVDEQINLNVQHFLQKPKDIPEVVKSTDESPPADGMMEDSTVAHKLGNISDVNGMGQSSISPELEMLLDRALGLGPVKGVRKVYTVDSPEIDDGENDGLEETKVNIRDKPYMSKAERRKIKNDQKSRNNTATCTDGDEENKEGNVLIAQPDKDVVSQKLVPLKVSRGQRGKLKKIKEKYSEQDEEERNIRMALLSSSGKVSKNVKEPERKQVSSGRETKPVTEQSDSSKICYKCKKPGHLSRDCQELIDETDNKKATIDIVARDATPDVPINQESKEHASDSAARVLMVEDDIREMAEEKEKLIDLDYLTGIPLPSDILLYAVPVCGPYSALQTYKYRVKITPGTAKKGKAAKTAMSLFSHMPESTSREKELMKACTDAELVAAIIGSAKITAPGLTQLKQKQKKEKKSSKQK